VWLVRDDTVLASVELAADRRARRVGLRGRDGIEGVLVLDPCRQVHTIGMRFPIDVAFCATDGRVLAISRLRPGRVSRMVWRSRWVVEAEAGTFGRWGLTPGDRLEVRRGADL
jgi:uncharacterized membrane protein (UPF0127 family)